MNVTLKGVKYRVYIDNKYVGYISLQGGEHGHWEAFGEKLKGCLECSLGTFGTKSQAVEKLQEFAKNNNILQSS